MSSPLDQEFDDFLERGLESFFSRHASRASTAREAVSSGESSVESELSELPGLPEPSGPVEPEAPDDDAPIGGDVPARIGRYEIVGPLGRGGIGVVVRGFDPILGRDVAIKIIHRQLLAAPDLMERFMEEARVCSYLEHPGVVPIHDIGWTVAGSPYFTMQVVEGTTLAEMLQGAESPEHTPEVTPELTPELTSELTPELTDQLLRIFEQVGETVAFAHARGVLHCDLKPANVMIGRFGEVRVMDWGFARVVRLPLDEVACAPPSRGMARRSEWPFAERTVDDPDRRIVGTPAYMPPEQARGEIESLDARSDVFALGSMLCEILTGEPAYVAASRDETFLKASKAWLDDAHQRLKASPAPLAELARRCLCADPDERPSDAGAVTQAVAEYRQSIVEHARALELEAAQAQVRFASEHRARRLTVALAAAIVIVLSLVSGWFWLASKRDEQTRGDVEAITNAMNLAEQLRKRAGRFRPWVPEHLDPAIHAAREAMVLARSDQISAQLRESAGSLLELLIREKKRIRAERAMLRSLVAIREHYGPETTAEALEFRYQRAFRRFGVDVDGAPDLAAKRIARSSILRELAVGLDEWAAVREGGPLKWQRLSKLAERVDDNPWRNRLRAAFRERDASQMMRLAEQTGEEDLAAQSYLLLAHCLQHRGEREAAIGVYRDGLRAHPADYRLVHDLAVTLGRSKPRPQQEILRLFSMVAAAQPKSAHAWCDLANTYFRMKLLAEARRTVDRALDVDTDYSPAWAVLARLEGAAGRPLSAIAAYKRSIKTTTRKRHGLFGPTSDLLAEAGFNHENVAIMRQALRINPKDAAMSANLGDTLMRLGCADASVAALEAGLKADPADSQTRCQLGRAIAQTGRFQEAVVHLRAGTDSARRDNEPWLERCVSWLRQTAAMQNDSAGIKEIRGVPVNFHPLRTLHFAQTALLMDRPATAAQFFAACRDEIRGRPANFRVLTLAAEASARAGLGLGKDADRSTEEQRAALRDDALTWLLDGLREMRESAEKQSASLTSAREATDRWLHGTRLAPFRVEQLADRGLAIEEQQKWRSLWSSVEAFRTSIDRVEEHGVSASVRRRK